MLRQTPLDDFAVQVAQVVKFRERCTQVALVDSRTAVAPDIDVKKLRTEDDCVTKRTLASAEGQRIKQP
jgi:hypothetical protein